MSSLTTEQKLDKLIAFLETIYGPNLIGDKPEPQPPILKPADGTYVIKPGGWGAADNPNAWKITNMRDFPELFKIVDPAERNVATNFATQELAQQYIDYQKSQWKEELEPDQGEEKPEEKPQPPAEGTTVKGPYPTIGKELKSTQRGPTTRHYASGKPDDETIEKNVKGIKARKHQFIVYVTMNKVEHDDQLSTKLGGTHMGTGWFDNTIQFESGQTGLGVERKHPSTKLEVKKGQKIGTILGKKIGMCSVFNADKNHVELWTDFEGSGWKKQVEGDNIGGFNPKAKEFEAQLRIDGLEDEPNIDTGSGPRN